MIRWFSRAWMAAVYAFLYIPIVSLVVFSFNESSLVTVWTRFSLKWYEALLRDDELIAGFFLSIKVALLCGLLSVILGTFGAYTLERYRRFRGRMLFASMMNLPLVMPEVILGLSVMLLLVMVQGALGFGQRDMSTILVGHTMLGMAYASVVISSRLRELNGSLEEAAQDLGARPLQVFFLITLPLIMPALLSAFLLTFTLSFDDVVISAFLAGPGATTLPVVIFSRAKFGLNPTVNAVAAVTIMVVTCAVVLSGLLEARARRRRLAETRRAMAPPAPQPAAVATAAAPKAAAAPAYAAKPAAIPAAGTPAPAGTTRR